MAETKINHSARLERKFLRAPTSSVRRRKNAMLLLNQRPDHNQPLVAADAEALGMAGGERAEHDL
jgi:hypothetical protein